MATFVTLAGALTTQDGKRFNWTKPARWTSEHVFVDAAGATVASFNPAQRGTVVAASPAVSAMSEWPMLALLGQFLIVNAALDTEVATTVAATGRILGGS